MNTRNSFIKNLAILFALLALAPRAHACLNDRHTERAEKEFRSHYGQSPEQPATPDQPNPTLLWHWQGFALAAAGIAMISASFKIQRRKSAEAP